MPEEACAVYSSKTFGYGFFSTTDVMISLNTDIADRPRFLQVSMSVWIRLRNLSHPSEVVPKLIFLWITKPLIHRSASLLVKVIDVFLRKTHKLSLCLSSNLHRPRYRLTITPFPLLNHWSNDFCSLCIRRKYRE